MKLNIFSDNNEWLEKYNKSWNKVSNSIKHGFDSEPVYNEKYLKTKKNLVKVKSTQIFMKKKCQKGEPLHCIALFIDNINFVCKMAKNEYPQKFPNHLQKHHQRKKVMT